jgi:Skp family chaperone for outer membrane proteins
MKRALASRILLITLIIGTLVPLTYAQQATKIAAVNSQAVLERSVEGKKVIAQLQQKDKSNQAALTKMDDDIRQLETKLNTQRLTLTDEALIQLNSDLEKKRKDRQRFAEDSLRDIQELQGRLFLKVQNELIAIIEQIGKERGYELIFDLAKSGAVYFNPAIDVTDDVVKRYDSAKAAAPTK